MILQKRFLELDDAIPENQFMRTSTFFMSIGSSVRFEKTKKKQTMNWTNLNETRPRPETDRSMKSRGPFRPKAKSDAFYKNVMLTLYLQYINW